MVNNVSAKNSARRFLLYPFISRGLTWMFYLRASSTKSLDDAKQRCRYVSKSQLYMWSNTICMLHNACFAVVCLQFAAEGSMLNAYIFVGFTRMMEVWWPISMTTKDTSTRKQIYNIARVTANDQLIGDNEPAAMNNRQQSRSVSWLLFVTTERRTKFMKCTRDYQTDCITKINLVSIWTLENFE